MTFAYMTQLQMWLSSLEPCVWCMQMLVSWRTDNEPYNFFSIVPQLYLCTPSSQVPQVFYFGVCPAPEWSSSKPTTVMPSWTQVTFLDILPNEPFTNPSSTCMFLVRITQTPIVVCRVSSRSLIEFIFLSEGRPEGCTTMEKGSLC